MFEALTRSRPAAVVLLLCFMCPLPALAQKRPGPALPTPTVSLPAGEHAASTGPTLQSSSSISAPSISIDAPQQQEGRYTRRGFVIGAIIGAVGGLGFGTFIGLFCQAEGDDCWSAVPLLTLLGAAGGGGVGALIGAAIPRPLDVEEDEEPGREPNRTPPQPQPEPEDAWSPADQTGSFGASYGWASATIEGGGGESFSGRGAVVRLAGYAELRSWFATGLEIGHASFGEGGAVRHAALALRGTLAGRVLSPFVSANIGAYQSTAPSLEYLGAGVGAGVRVTPFENGRFFIDAEGRWSRNAHNIEPTRMTTLSVGGGFYW